MSISNWKNFLNSQNGEAGLLLHHQIKTKAIMKTQLIILALSLTGMLHAQKYMTREGKVHFFSDAPMEDIEAVNEQMSSILNAENGDFAFLVPIKGFIFEKALMQEHFNENYLESGQYPNASFKGKIENIDEIDLEKDGTYPAQLKGIMEIHGVKQEMSEEVTLTVKDGKVSIEAKFNARPKDYKIKIPSGKKDNIADLIEVTVNATYAKR